MAKRAEILGEKLLAEGRFRLTRTRARIEETNGAVRTLDHEIYHYGPAAAVLLYEPERRVVLLVKQFRLGAFLGDGALDLIEVCAGMLDDDAPEACARREAWEETGVRLTSLRHAFDAFMSPGGMTEKIACFVAPYAAGDRLGLGGGVDRRRVRSNSSKWLMTTRSPRSDRAGFATPRQSRCSTTPRLRDCCRRSRRKPLSPTRGEGAFWGQTEAFAIARFSSIPAEIASSTRSSQTNSNF